jgi:hypothetical protein
MPSGNDGTRIFVVVDQIGSNPRALSVGSKYENCLESVHMPHARRSHRALNEGNRDAY